MERGEAAEVIRNLLTSPDAPALADTERDALIVAMHELTPPENDQGVRPGQVWQGWDVRERPHGGSRFRVQSVDATHAHVTGLDGKQPRKIKLTRMRPTSSGYRKVSE